MDRGRLVGNLIFATLAVGAIVLIVVFVTNGTSTASHKVSVTVPEATGVLGGDFIRAGGNQVGAVTGVQAIDGGRAAKITMNVDDNVWPLTKGTSMTVRWGGTINEYDRYIDLVRGPSDSGSIVTNGVYPASAFHMPVEYGSLLSDFTPKVRAGLKAALNNGGDSFQNAQSGLKSALNSTPPALTQVNDVITDLDANEGTLRDLLGTTNSVVTAINTADPGLGDLLQGAGGTFTAIANQDTNLEKTLSGAPETMEVARTTLARANTTLAEAKQLTTNIKPGVNKLIEISQPLNHLLTTISAVGPDLNSTLSTAVSTAPHVTTLVNKVHSLTPQLDSVTDQLNTALDCIRPYTPEIAAFGSNWGSALSGNVDGTVYIRAAPEEIIPAVVPTDSSTSGKVQSQFPGLAYDFPQAPGAAADEPWYLPQCGITSQDYNASADPESAYWDSSTGKASGIN